MVDAVDEEGEAEDVGEEDEFLEQLSVLIRLLVDEMADLLAARQCIFGRLMLGTIGRSSTPRG